MIVFRLSRSRYSSDLSGKGAELSGGRWNSKGIALVYTAENISLCVAEVAVHLPLGITPVDYELISIEIPDNEIQEVDYDSLPDEWQSKSFIKFTKEIGDKFVKKPERMILKVPSAVVEGEFNFLINPFHKNIKKVEIKRIQPFAFDRRLFVR